MVSSASSLNFVVLLRAKVKDLKIEFPRPPNLGTAGSAQIELSYIFDVSEVSDNICFFFVVFGSFHKGCSRFFRRTSTSKVSNSVNKCSEMHEKVLKP